MSISEHVEFKANQIICSNIVENTSWGIETNTYELYALTKLNKACGYVDILKVICLNKYNPKRLCLLCINYKFVLNLLCMDFAETWGVVSIKLCLLS